MEIETDGSTTMLSRGVLFTYGALRRQLKFEAEKFLKVVDGHSSRAPEESPLQSLLRKSNFYYPVEIKSNFATHLWAKIDRVHLLRPENKI